MGYYNTEEWVIAHIAATQPSSTYRNDQPAPAPHVWRRTRCKRHSFTYITTQPFADLLLPLGVGRYVRAACQRLVCAITAVTMTPSWCCNHLSAVTQTKRTQCPRCAQSTVSHKTDFVCVHYTFCDENAKDCGVHRNFVALSAVYDLRATVLYTGSAHRG